MFSAEVCLLCSSHLCVCWHCHCSLCVRLISCVLSCTSTPLSLMTDHFSDFKSRAQNLSVLVKKNKLITFCSTEWPTFHVGWPSEGTFDSGTVHQVRDIIFQLQIRHPDQAPPPSFGKTFFASTEIFYPSGVGDTCKKKPKESQGA